MNNFFAYKLFQMLINCTLKILYDNEHHFFCYYLNNLTNMKGKMTSLRSLY